MTELPPNSASLTNPMPLLKISSMIWKWKKERNRNIGFFRLTKFGTATDSRCLFCLFDLIWFFTSQSTIFQLRRDGSSWAESVLCYRINVSCSMTRRSDAGEALNRGPLVSSSQCLNTKCGQGKRFGTGPGRRPDWAGYGSRLFGQTHSCHPLVRRRG